jgi:hypothetical protein
MLNTVDRSYPPTHQYSLLTMKPKGSLKERLEIMESEFPWFFSGTRFLDVASNWGYFCFSNKKNFEEIVGIDINKNCTDYCKQHNRYGHIHFHHTSFRDYSSPLGFDKIFVGNVAHHLFMDTHDWSWIAKLHALSDGQVLVEGAQTTDCKDIRELVSPELHGRFNTFQMEMAKYFKLRKIVKTTSYTPDRYLMLYEKIMPEQVHLKDLKVKKIYSKQDFKVFETDNNRVAKVFVRDPSALQIWNGLIRVRLACNSPVTNGMSGEIYVGKRMVGWLEDKLKGDMYLYFENEKALWNKICEHNIFLAKNGYVDLDTATINFNKKTNLLFDKSCVFPINKLLDKSIDIMPVLFNQSYRMRGLFFTAIMDALKTRDSKQVEESFRRGIIA